MKSLFSLHTWMKRVMITPMLKSRPFLWGIAVVGLIVSTAGISAGVAKGGLSGPAWFVAGVAGVAGAVAAVMAALRPVVVKVVEAGVDRSMKQSDAARELRDRLGGPKGKFPRVSDIRDRALRYGVQRAIPLDHVEADGLSADLPRYLPRTIDGQIRSALTARSATGGMVIVKGNSTWGKSRTMFEAVSQVLGGWVIIAPSNANDLRALVESGLTLRQTVIWLDELADFLAGGDPLTRDVVQRAVDKGAILVGTIWKDVFAALTEPPKKSSGNGAVRLEHDSGTVDDLAEARAILTATYADLIEMPGALDDDESTVASALAKQDSRWAHALAGAGELSPIQVLAAAPQLLHRFRSPDDEAGGVVLNTAVALLAMEHPRPVPADLIRRVAQPAIPPTLELDSDRWFDKALAWATRPVRGTIAPLQTYRSDGGDDDRAFVAPDVLVSAALEDGRMQDQVNLDLTLTHATPEACAAIGSFFYFRDEDDVAEPFLRRAAECGVVRAFGRYAYVLSAQEGRAQEAEAWYLKAVEAGDAGASFDLGYLLADQEGRTADAEAWYLKAVEAGNTVALFNLGVLAVNDGRVEDAEMWYRKAMDAGNSDASISLGVLLGDQEGRVGEARELLAEAADAENPRALYTLGYLAGREGRAEESEELLRKAADLGDIEALVNLGGLLGQMEGRDGEAEECFRRAVDHGYVEAMMGLGYVLSHQEGRTDEAEEWLRKAADAGDLDAMVGLGTLLFDQEGRAEESDEWYRKAIEAGDPNALTFFGDALKEQGRYSEARPILAQAIAGGDPYAMRMMGELDLLEGHREAGRAWLRKAASLGVERAAEILRDEFDEDPPAAE